MDKQSLLYSCVFANKKKRKRQGNKVTATPIVRGWAGAEIVKVNWAYGQEQ